MGAASLLVRQLFTALALVCMTSACASANLRTANSAAVIGVQGLSATTVAYDAALASQIELSSLQFWGGPAPGRIDRGDFLAENAKSIRYRAAIATLTEHAALTRAYFASLQEYTSPGTNSATAHTDAQLAQSTGIANAIKLLNPEFGAIAHTGIRLVLQSIADTRLRRHLEASGEDIATALLIQEGAMTALAMQTAGHRRQICSARMAAFEREALAASASRSGRMTAQQVQALNDGRRTAAGCVREASEAQAAARALGDARRAYVALLEGRLDPNTAALVISDVADATRVATEYLNREEDPGDSQDGR